MIDTGNSFASEITNKFAKKLGFKPSQLLKSPTDQVKQAGNGAKLQIIGKLLENVLSDYFHFDGLNFKFPMKDIYVIKNLDQDINFSVKFLKRYSFLVDLKQNCLRFNNFNIEDKITLIPDRKE